MKKIVETWYKIEKWIKWWSKVCLKTKCDKRNTHWIMYYYQFWIFYSNNCSIYSVSCIIGWWMRPEMEICMEIIWNEHQLEWNVLPQWMNLICIATFWKRRITDPKYPWKILRTVEIVILRYWRSAIISEKFMKIRIYQKRGEQLKNFSNCICFKEKCVKVIWKKKQCGSLAWNWFEIHLPV